MKAVLNVLQCQHSDNSHHSSRLLKHSFILTDNLDFRLKNLTTASTRIHHFLHNSKAIPHPLTVTKKYIPERETAAHYNFLPFLLFFPTLALESLVKVRVKVQWNKESEAHARFAHAKVSQ